MRRSIHLVPSFVAALVCSAGVAIQEAAAQCTPGWRAGTANSDVNALIRWLKMWDPDGAGPQAPLLVAAGDFSGTNSAGTSSATRIAAWDGSNWSALGTGLDGPGYCLATVPSDNRLYVCGTSFTTAGGNPAKRIAAYDGNAWSDLGTGSGNVPTLTLLNVTTLSSNSIAVTGAFTAVAGEPALRVASYNTSTGTWSGLGAGMSSTTSAATVLQNGDLVVGGASLTTGDGSVTINRIARWDGSAWHPLASGLDGLVRCLIVMPNGDLIAGGAFVNAGSTTVNRIARWNGTAWSALGAGMDLDVYALAVMPNGDLVAAGDFTHAGGNDANRIARWNGSTWSAMGSGFPAVVRALEVLPSGDLAAGGDFLTAGGNPAAHFAIWSSASAPVIVTQPESQTVPVTSTATFALTATGSSLTYQWQQQDLFNLPDFIDIHDGGVYGPFGEWLANSSGTNTNELVLSDFSGVAQIFRCVVTNSCGHVESTEVTLTFPPPCGTSDFNGDGDFGTDADIEAFFACLAGTCCPTCYEGGSDFNADGDFGTDADIESFFRVLAGAEC